MDNRSVTSNNTQITVSGGSAEMPITPDYIMDQLTENVDYQEITVKVIEFEKDIIFTNQAYYIDTGWTYILGNNHEFEFENGTWISGDINTKNGANFYVISPQRLIDLRADSDGNRSNLSLYGVTIHITEFSTGSADSFTIFMATAANDTIDSCSFTIINDAPIRAKPAICQLRKGLGQIFDLSLIGINLTSFGNYPQNFTGRYYPRLDPDGNATDNIYINSRFGQRLDLNDGVFNLDDSAFVRINSEMDRVVNHMVTNPIINSFTQFQTNRSQSLTINIDVALTVKDEDDNPVSGAVIQPVYTGENLAATTSQSTNSSGVSSFTIEEVFKITAPEGEDFSDTAFTPVTNHTSVTFIIRKYGFHEARVSAIINGQGIIRVSPILIHDDNFPDPPGGVPTGSVSINAENNEFTVQSSHTSLLDVYKTYKNYLVIFIDSIGLNDLFEKILNTYTFGKSLRLDDGVVITDNNATLTLTDGSSVITAGSTGANFMYQTDTITSHRVLARVTNEEPEEFSNDYVFNVKQIDSSNNITNSPVATRTTNSIFRHSINRELHLFAMRFDTEVTLITDAQHLSTSITSFKQLNSFTGLTLENVRSTYELLNDFITYDPENKTLGITYVGTLNTLQLIQYLQYYYFTNFNTYVAGILDTSLNFPDSLHPFNYDSGVFTYSGLMVTPSDQTFFVDPSVIWNIGGILGDNADGQNIIHFDAVDVISIEVPNLSGSFTVKIYDVTNDVVLQDFITVTELFANQVTIGDQYRIVVTANGYIPAIYNHTASTAGNKVAIFLRKEEYALTVANATSVPDTSPLTSIYAFTSDTITFTPLDNVRADKDVVYAFFHSVKQSQAYLNYLLDINSQDVMRLTENAITFSRNNFTLKIADDTSLRLQLDTFFGYSVDSTNTITPQNNVNFAVQVDGFSHSISGEGVNIAVRNAIDRAELLTIPDYIANR